jgi:hypothetical protein
LAWVIPAPGIEAKEKLKILQHVELAMRKHSSIHYTHPHEIRFRAVHITKKKISELHRIKACQ